MRKKLKMPITVTALFMLSIAGNTSTAPELPLLEQAKNSAEYPILKQLQSLTFDLQMLELVVKNRRDPQIESKISGSIDAIQTESLEVGKQFAALRGSQIGVISALFTSAKKHSKLVGVSAAEWDELLNALRDGRTKEGMLVVHSTDSLNVLNLEPVRIGKQSVWKVTLPESDKSSFWTRLGWALKKTGSVNTASQFSQTNLKKKIEPIADYHAESLKLVELFYKDSHKKLYTSFEEQRYGIMTRMTQAKKALAELGSQNSTMGTPEEFGALYNQLLDNLYSYGVDISFNGEQRDFRIKGILFGESPEAAKEALTHLKFNPNSVTFNSPSS